MPFNLFRKKSPLEVLENRYNQLLKEAHALSRTNRMESDQKMSEAEEVLRQIRELEAHSEK